MKRARSAGRSALRVSVLLLLGVAAMLVLWRAGSVGAAKGGNHPDCEAARCSVEAAIATQCPCDAGNHGQYVRCVAQAVKSAGIPKQCAGAIVRCAAHSRCGRSGAVACAKKGRCSIKRSADRCEAGGGTVAPGPSCCPSCAGEIQCCLPSGSAGGAFTCELLPPEACAAQSGVNEGVGTCAPNPCAGGTTSTTQAATTTTTAAATTSTTGAATTTTTAAATTTTGAATTTTTAAATTTTTAAATTTTTGAATTTTTSSTTSTTIGLACCAASRIETLSQPGTLEVSTLPAFPFPQNVHTVIDVGAADASCRHTGTVPPGGFTVPVFCIPALQFTSSVTATGCESGGAAGQAVVWDAAAPAPGPDINRVGDTSDPDGNSCGTLGTGCVTSAGGAGADTRGNIDTTRGGNANGITGKVHTAVDIPVHSVTWVAADTSCPDTDGTFNPGTDTPVTDFFFILSPTSGHTTATYTDLNGDGCKRAGNGPDSKTGDGSPADGPCCTVGQATTVAATGIAFTGGAPLYDITFRSITPTTISNCATPSSSATCTLTTNACQD
jgi:hypothetical protein